MFIVHKFINDWAAGFLDGLLDIVSKHQCHSMAQEGIPGLKNLDANLLQQYLL